MALKPVVASLNEVPEAIRSEYEQRDGKYVLKLDGDPPGYVKASDLAEANGKVVEFRDNNVKLLKALGADSIDSALQRAGMLAGLTAERLAELKDLDPVAARAALARVKELEAKGLKTDTDMAAHVKSALDAALAPIQAQLQASDRARAEAQARADKALIRQAIGDPYLKAGGKPSAIDFIVAEFEKDFRVQENAVKAQENKFSAAKPGQPLTTDEWLVAATKRFDYAFEASNGGSAKGSGNGGNGGPGGSRPGVRQIVNPTPQELGGLTFVKGKGLVDKTGQPVEIVDQAS